MEKIIRILLIVGGCYLLADGIIHLTDMRLLSVKEVWPEDALIFAQFMSRLYGSFVILAGLLCLIIQKDIKKNKSLLQVAAIWAFIHSCLLVTISINTNFTKIYDKYPSVYVWMPFYNSYLYFEIFLLFIVSALTAVWLKSLKSKN